ncbi:MAG TPA: hypothetical protein PLS94_08395 [Prolixibacteraceae bacterium]|nr:hypothetical protein [Prolixibacteraceae bacterium]HPR60565.1 hypothetical protein [Prolixibacteraceae bacterium]
MNLLRISFLAVLFLFQFTSCNKADDPNPVTKSVLKITVSLPDGWTPVSGSVLEHQYMKGTASFMIKEEKALNNMDLDEAVEKAIDVLSSTFNNFSSTDPEAMLVDGHEALSIIFAYNVSVGGTVIQMKMQSVYVMVNQQCQLIAFGDQESLFANLSNDISQILAGIKFVLE